MGDDAKRGGVRRGVAGLVEAHALIDNVDRRHGRRRCLLSPLPELTSRVLCGRPQLTQEDGDEYLMRPLGWDPLDEQARVAAAPGPRATMWSDTT